MARPSPGDPETGDLAGAWARWRQDRPPAQNLHLDTAAAGRASAATLRAAAAHAEREAAVGAYVAQAEAEILERIERRSGRLRDVMNVKMLNARHDVQGLAMSPVFTEFPAHVNALRFEVDQLSLSAEHAVNAGLRRSSERLRSPA